MKAIAKNGLPLYAHCSHAIAASFKSLHGSRSMSSANSVTNLQHCTPKMLPYRHLRGALVRVISRHRHVQLQGEVESSVVLDLDRA